MKNATSQPAPETSLVNYNLKRIKLHEKPTRRQQKHDMLLTFMAQAVPKIKSPSKPAPRKPSLLKSLLSIFL